MDTMTTMPRASDGLTVADLDGFPDDGWRYELLDGTLVVSASPSRAHQRSLIRLVVLLEAACPPDLELLAAPFDVTLDDVTLLQPDLLVAPRDQLTARNLPGAPLLAVEILSPSTRLIDLNLKKPRYELAGCASYWVVDPLEPRLLAWELVDRAYVQVADVSGDESWTATAPYAVAITPSALVD